MPTNANFIDPTGGGRSLYCQLHWHVLAWFWHASICPVAGVRPRGFCRLSPGKIINVAGRIIEPFEYKSYRSGDLLDAVETYWMPWIHQKDIIFQDSDPPEAAPGWNTQFFRIPTRRRQHPVEAPGFEVANSPHIQYTWQFRKTCFSKSWFPGPQ